MFTRTRRQFLPAVSALDTRAVPTVGLSVDPMAPVVFTIESRPMTPSDYSPMEPRLVIFLTAPAGNFVLADPLNPTS